MRLVRAALAIGFIGLIASLFWDPMTAELTQPDNLASPFHLSGTIVEIQGQAVPQAPYQMTNRIWWTMLIPALPLFFMVTGHETWRRICPLSFVSQIPRYLGWNRTRALFSRKSGLVETPLALVGKDSFWRKHVWAIQFGLFFLALNARILFVNSNRTALGLFLIAALLAAFGAGLLWGGKTWCNYICPIAIVQKIYTEPRGGLLESQANTSGQTITQAMCRTTTKDGERSTCVGCTVNCPDIDIEKSYWENITNPEMPMVYYGFFGLILGFYGSYYLYSGNWEYYFSGAWTHDPSQFARLLRPGLMLAGRIVAIPEILSVPLILGSFVLLAIVVGKALEWAYRNAARHGKARLSEAEITSHCLSFSAYLSINTFYLFGGRPNLMLLPTPAMRGVDFLIVALTTLWFWRATQRSPMRYRREGLAASLLEQLRKLPVDIAKYLEGRQLDDLKTDEIYVLAKTLPRFSHDQRLRAYRNILQDALLKGSADAASSLEALREIRVEISVSEDEHREALQDLELDGLTGTSFAQNAAATYENWIRVENYQQWLEPLLVARLGRGQSLARILEEIEMAESIGEYRALYQISAAEHASVVMLVAGGGANPLLHRARLQLDLLADNATLVFGLRRKMLSVGQQPNAELWQPLGALLIASAATRSAALYGRLFSILLTLGDSAVARQIAVRIARLSGSDIEAPLGLAVSAGTRTTWAQSLPPVLFFLLHGGLLADADLAPGDDGLAHVIDFHPSVGRSTTLAGVLAGIATGASSVLGAVALKALSELDLERARQLAVEITHREGQAHRLMTETIASLSAPPILPEPRAIGGAVTITLLGAAGGQQMLLFEQDRISIGRAADNDLVVPGLMIAPHHAMISHDGIAIEIAPVDHGAEITVNGRQATGERLAIASGTRIGFLPPGQPGPVLVIDWQPGHAGISLETHDTMSKLLWLSQADVFRAVGLKELAEIAALTKVWRCGQGAWLCRAGEPSSDAFLLSAGAAETIVWREGVAEVVGRMSEGALVDDVGVITGHARTSAVRIQSSTARVLTINAVRLRRLMEQDSHVSLGLLQGVADYAQSRPLEPSYPKAEAR